MDSTVEPVDSFPYDRPTSLDDPNARLLRLWGKTTADPELFHPAIFHMLDVGHVAQHLLSQRATPRWRRVQMCIRDSSNTTFGHST